MTTKTLKAARARAARHRAQHDSMILKKEISAPKFNIDEALRYAGTRGIADPGTKSLALDCFNEAAGQISYKVCYSFFDISVSLSEVTFAGKWRADSKALGALLQGCDEVIIFAATVGVGLDRLITRYGDIAPSKSLMMQSIGAERIEALCDEFCNEMDAELSEYGKHLTRRFSPGYADLPLEFQKTIFRLLEPEKHIGLTLNDSLLMTPSKSVTAIAGVSSHATCYFENGDSKCKTCAKTDCAYRSSL